VVAAAEAGIVRNCSGDDLYTPSVLRGYEQSARSYFNGGGGIRTLGGP
jgi:hypothetical protein